MPSGGRGFALLPLFFRREKIFFHLRFFHLPFIFTGYTLIIPQDAVNTKKEMENMKKILICMMVLAMLFSTAAFAATRDEALSAAQALISAEDPDAQLVESDEDDGYYEFEFTSDTARYDVLVDRDAAVIKAEIEYRNISRTTEATLDEAAAIDAALTFLRSGEAQYALLERDDGRYEWNVFVTAGEDVGIVGVQAETGEIRSFEAYYGLASQILTADEAVAALIDAQGDLTIVDFDLDFDDDRRMHHHGNGHGNGNGGDNCPFGDGCGLRYDGKCRVGDRVYEFEMDAVTGDIYEWERD